MTREQAKQVLLLYRPGTADWQDPEVGQAIELARQDPELGQWFLESQAFHTAARARFREIQVPEHLRANLRNVQPAATAPEHNFTAIPLPGARAQVAVLRPASAGWHKVAWAAAAMILIAALFVLWPRTVHPDRFGNYRDMMVSTALRGYNMECATNDMRQLRAYFQDNGTPADYRVAEPLSTLHLLGGTALTWRSHPVSMVCFARPDNQKVWLFVMDRDVVKDPPTTLPAELTIATLRTASWTEGNKTYVLAGPVEPGFPKKYL